MKIATVSLRKQEQGIGHVLMVVLILVVLGIIGFAGYTVMGKNKKASTVTTTTTAATEQAAATSSCVATYHDANLCKFSAQPNLDKMSYKGTLTSTTPDGTSSLVFESDGKGNTSLSGTGNGQTMNIINIGNVGYVETDGVWYKYPAGTSTGTNSNPTADMSLVLGAGITYKPLGKEACGSRSCFKYQVTDAAMPTTTQYVWFDTGDYLAREWKAVDATNGTTDMTIDYVAVHIAAPAGAKDLSASLGQ